jgi:uncharacterized protein (TIGR02231 family)
MWKRTIPLLGIGVALVVANLLSRHDPVNALEDRAAVEVAAAPVGAAPELKITPSRIATVTVYPNSALVTREVDVPAVAGRVELTVSPLPPTAASSSLYTEGTDGIRVLTTRFRSRPILEDTRADVRKLQDELKQLQLAREKIEGDLAAVQDNNKLLTKMESFLTVSTVQATEKNALNSDAAIAMAKHIRESRVETMREQVGLKQQIQANQEKAEAAQKRLTALTSGVARIENDAVIVVEKTNAAPGKVRLNYLVDGAAWHPQYKLRAGKNAQGPVQLEYLAAVEQHTKEDWTNVNLVLSTAQPMLNAAPPELQTLQVSVVPKGTTTSIQPDAMAVEEQIKHLRSQAQRSFNDKKASSGVIQVNTAAAQEQSLELFNPDAAVKRGCMLGAREGPTVTYHLATQLSLPSRADDQMLEVARIEFKPEYYYKTVPILSPHVYRLADLVNKSNYVLLPGEATMYIGSDFVGQMSLPLVVIGEQFTAGFGVDPQLQVQRQMVDKARTTQGGNQSLRYDYRITISSYKDEKVKMQVWERLPFAESDTVGITLLKTTPELSNDDVYKREQRPTNLLRWDIEVPANANGPKSVSINYEFKLELDRQMTISSFQTASAHAMAPAAPLPAITSAEAAKIRVNMEKLSPEDRRMAETQVFCAIDQDSPLGSMGPIYKVMVKGQPVFLCCKGCEKEAKDKPNETLAALQKLMSRPKTKP